MRTLLIVCLTLAAACGDASTNGRVRVQRMLPIETTDTILDEGELVVVEDEAGAGIPSLRIGDGVTPGGQIAESAYAARAGQRRMLRRAEYHVAISGATTYSNGVYTLLTPRSGVSSLDPANVGAITITPVAGGLLSGVTYDSATTNAVVTDTAQDGYASWETLSIAGAESSRLALLPGGGDVACSISNIAVYAWTGLHLIGHTNDLRAAVLWVGDPSSDDDAISRGYFEGRLDGRWGNDWARHRASTNVLVNWHAIALNPFISLTSTSRGFSFRDRDGTNLLSVSRARRTYEIVAFQLSGTNVSLWVEDSAEFSTAPWVEHAPISTGTASWKALSTTTTWPTSSWVVTSTGSRYKAYRLDATSPGPGFLRVAVSDLSSTADGLTLDVPIRLHNIDQIIVGDAPLGSVVASVATNTARAYTPTCPVDTWCSPDYLGGAALVNPGAGLHYIAGARGKSGTTGGFASQLRRPVDLAYSNLVFACTALTAGDTPDQTMLFYTYVSDPVGLSFGNDQASSLYSLGSGTSPFSFLVVVTNTVALGVSSQPHVYSAIMSSSSATNFVYIYNPRYMWTRP
jgi:hypothetical protein